MNPAFEQLAANLIWIVAAARELDPQDRERFVTAAAEAVAQLALWDFEDRWLRERP